ncbi:MAG: hypothetical protein MUE56_07735, partial [Ignavibacteria bacterium]|nr:hypothetical protein [Ignavibacteria bacterium]
MENRKINIFAAALFSVIISLVFQGYAFCQDDTVKKYAELDGHTFLNNTNIGLPFTGTYYKTVLGAGQTLNLDVPDVYVNNTKVLNLSGDLIYTALNFTYQQQIRDWLAFNGIININAQVATETGALIAQGINLSSSFNFSWKARVYENRKMSLSSSLYLSRISYYVVDIMGFARKLIDSGGFTRDNKIINSVPLVRGGMKLNYAYAINKTFGGVASLSLDYGESAYRDEANVWNYSYGFGIDANLLPKQNVPLGFLVGGGL